MVKRHVRFQAPPGWPVPPDGWVPPADWRKPGTWPTPPEGWVFYLELPEPERARRHGFEPTCHPAYDVRGRGAPTPSGAASLIILVFALALAGFATGCLSWNAASPTTGAVQACGRAVTERLQSSLPLAAGNPAASIVAPVTSEINSVVRDTGGVIVVSGTRGQGGEAWRFSCSVQTGEGLPHVNALQVDPVSSHAP